MTGETVDELRARLGALAAAAATSAVERKRFAFELARCWPAIDGMLARLTAAEAVCDALDRSYTEIRWPTVWSKHVAWRAVALREHTS